MQTAVGALDLSKLEGDLARMEPHVRRQVVEANQRLARHLAEMRETGDRETLKPAVQARVNTICAGFITVGVKFTF